METRRYLYPHFFSFGEEVVSTVASVTIKTHRVSGSLPYLCSWVHNGMAITGKVYERHDGWLGADLRKGGEQSVDGESFEIFDRLGASSFGV